MTGRLKGHILIIDDNETTLFVFSRWLRQAGFEVTEAASGAEGLAAIADRGCDLVVLDVNLPDMTGYQVAELIKADPATSAIPVMHVSATAIEPTDKSTGLRRGADAYLVEPLEREELLATVGALLRYSAARRQAETLAHRLGWLHETSLALNATPDIAHLVRAAASAAADISDGRAIAAVVGTDRSAVASIAGAGDRSVAALGSAAPSALVTLSLEEFAGLVGSPRTVLARALPGAAFDDRPLRVLEAKGRAGATSGVLIVQAADDDPGMLDDVLKQLAQAMTVAAHNLRLLAREHSIAITLQHSLLPTIPTVPWLDIAVRYAASSAQIEVGGDFYDVVVVDDTRVALIIGDVQGHSLQAATIMATLRTSLNAYLLAGRSPGAVLRSLNIVLMRTYPDVIATVCCVLIDREGHAIVANAGHFAPIISMNGSATSLRSGGLLLGIDSDLEETTADIPLGSTIVMFTDGLIEQRHESLAIGISAAESVIAKAGPGVETVCDRLLADVGRGVTAEDDIAVLAVRIHSFE